jgi:uncharacterized membrane protein YecN with MAPEG domain
MIERALWIVFLLIIVIFVGRLLHVI